MTVFGRGVLPPPPPIPTCTVVSAKRFLHDAKHGKLGEIAFLGLIQSSVAIKGARSNATAMCCTLSVDLAGSASDQAPLECMLSSLQMYLKSRVSHLQLMYSIGLIL